MSNSIQTLEILRKIKEHRDNVVTGLVVLDIIDPDVSPIVFDSMHNLVQDVLTIMGEDQNK